MRTIGLIGGMSWESSAEYYRILNEETRARLGGHHCARSVMVTVDFAEIEAMQRAGDWAAAGRLLADAAARLERAGADLVLLCTNTMHQVAPAIEAAITVPFVHLVDATAERVKAAGLTTVALLGTRFTMEMDFYRDRMRGHGIDLVIPDEPARTRVHDVIYDELTRGRVEPASREFYRETIRSLAARGAQGVILGCTEITLLIAQPDSPIPIFDSTRIHATQALTLALS
ncbi:aspartate/glutamate racemase family protein [Bailinhaonella thermotolerans]|uniref:Aspartate/glutamate racemase family protein n=1 Tax=Bailinhaonella thermotolerans TaxID=1070861 RepID=A0A3A4BQC3_9ACTN|nr:aspartate/glutamate racemase family protein [Bailinhaonella thermotolerans]RJL33346.1 aspartate/glutamate racemase family protein [Bailinhaonella thermotolerans]